MLGDHSWPHSPSWEGRPQPVSCPQQHMDRAGVLVGVLADKPGPHRVGDMCALPGGNPASEEVSLGTWEARLPFNL